MAVLSIRSISLHSKFLRFTLHPPDQGGSLHQLPALWAGVLRLTLPESWVSIKADSFTQKDPTLPRGWILLSSTVCVSPEGGSTGPDNKAGYERGWARRGSHVAESSVLPILPRKREAVMELCRDGPRRPSSLPGWAEPRPAHLAEGAHLRPAR